jgi:hypothetical protein
MNVEAMPIMKGLSDKNEVPPTPSRGGVRVRMRMAAEQPSKWAPQR